MSAVRDAAHGMIQESLKLATAGKGSVTSVQATTAIAQVYALLDLADAVRSLGNSVQNGG